MTRDRDEAVDRLLRRSAAGMDPVAGACLDAETLAAWADGSLHGDALLRARDHSADCARCQALLATMAQTAPAPQVREPIWARWRFQWLVPAAAAATAIAVYIAVPNQRSASEVLSEAETAKQAAQPVHAPDGRAVSQPTEVAVAQGQAPSVAPDNSSAAFKDATPSTAPESKAAANAQASTALAGDAKATASADNAAAPADSRLLKEEVTVTTAQAARADEAHARQEADDSAVARRAPPPPVTAAAPLARSAAAAMAPVEVISPASGTRWRAVGGAIQSSTDGGATWTASVASSADVLAAGTSPSPSVCWFVGRAGVVFVTSDGRQWNRRVVPGGGDLVSVVATDGGTASVADAAGRVYRTTDGGQTWR